MDIRTVRKTVKIINKVQGRIVSDAFAIPHEEERVVDTRRLPQSVLEDLQIFYENGSIDVEVVDSENKESKKSANTENVKTENGHEHTVFKPSDRAINVQEIDTSGKSVEVGFSKIDAVELLDKHWKTLEKEVSGIKDMSKLKTILIVAKENAVAKKKLEIIENRIGELI